MANRYFLYLLLVIAWSLTSCSPNLEQSRDIKIKSGVAVTEKDPERLGENLTSEIALPMATPATDPLPLNAPKASNPFDSATQESLFDSLTPGPPSDGTTPSQETDLKLGY